MTRRQYSYLQLRKKIARKACLDIKDCYNREDRRIVITDNQWAFSSRWQWNAVERCVIMKRRIIITQVQRSSHSYLQRYVTQRPTTGRSYVPSRDHCCIELRMPSPLKRTDADWWSLLDDDPLRPTRSSGLNAVVNEINYDVNVDINDVGFHALRGPRRDSR